VKYYLAVFFLLCAGINGVAVAGESNLKTIDSLSQLAGMADYCVGVFEDTGDLANYQILRSEDARLSSYIASLLSSETEANIARLSRLEGLKHYQELFAGDTVACKNLVRTLSLVKTN